MSSAADSGFSRLPGQETTRDAFLGGRVEALQPRKGPRTAIDALFLAAAVPGRAGQGERILEAGQGSGVASLALAARIRDAHVTGIEIQPALCDLAMRNAALNGMQDRVAVVEGDLTAPPAELKRKGLMPESFNHAAANPPYLNAARTRPSPDPAIAMAHAAGDGALAEWIGFLARMVMPGGSVTLIHRADALDALLALLRVRFGALAVFPLFPHEGEPAHRVIVQGIKGSRAPLTLRKGMVLHRSDGGFTMQAEAILKTGMELVVGMPAGQTRRK